jgi:hypothetical protein
MIQSDSFNKKLKTYFLIMLRIPDNTVFPSPGRFDL